MSRPRLLDGCSGAGGAGKGYADAGFDVFGVDLHEQPRYPFGFQQADILAFLSNVNRVRGFFDAIHVSPPCQRWSDLARRNGNADDWPDLIEPVREQLEKIGLPYVIENVPEAPLRDPVILCGTMFREEWWHCDNQACERCHGSGEYPTGGGYTRAWVPCMWPAGKGLRVIRHRAFESSVPLCQPTCGKHPLVFTHDKRKAHYGKLDQNTAFVQVTGGGNCSVANKRDAMGIDWMIGRELNEAIPPAYTRYVGLQLIRALEKAA